MRAINKASDGGDWEFVMNRVFDGREQTIGVNTHDLVLDDTTPRSGEVSRSYYAYSSFRARETSTELIRKALLEG